MAYQNVVDAAAAQWSADTLAITTSDGVVAVASADPLRRSVTVYTDPDSVGTLYLVPNAGQRSGGVRIVPGAGFEFHHGAPIYGYASGGDVLVNVVAETGAVC